MIIPVDCDISIHALRGEGDPSTLPVLLASMSFLSTPSAGRATEILRNGDLVVAISIHALRGEGDTIDWAKAQAGGVFLSTPSAGRATCTKQK